jgi:hypothetical protein
VAVPLPHFCIFESTSGKLHSHGGFAVVAVRNDGVAVKAGIVVVVGLSTLLMDWNPHLPRSLTKDQPFLL